MGFLLSGRALVQLAPSRNHPIGSGCNRKADTSRQRVDDKILQPRMPTRCPKLQDFEEADRQHGDYGSKCSVSRVGQSERKPDQDEGERVLPVLTEVGMRTEARRSQGREGDGGG